jgi:hypothetical protein
MATFRTHSKSEPNVHITVSFVPSDIQKVKYGQDTLYLRSEMIPFIFWRVGLALLATLAGFLLAKPLVELLLNTIRSRVDKRVRYGALPSNFHMQQNIYSDAA